MTEPEYASRREVRAAAPAPDGSPSRAGRDLPLAIATGLTLGALAAGTLLIHPVAFTALICAAAVVAVWEMRQALAEGGLYAPFVPVAAATSSRCASPRRASSSL